MARSKEDEDGPTTPSGGERVELSEAVQDAYRDMEAARVRVQAAQESKSSKVLDRAGNSYNAIQEKLGTAQNAAAIVDPAIQSDLMKPIREGITTFAESLPGVLKALDEVANIHPFIKVAVGAFRVVVELDVKRRDNEKKITVIFVEMRDMMRVLIELRTIHDEDSTGPDGTTIKARLQELVQRTADDIKACANACDAYAKKRLFVKVLKSSSWDEKFKGFLTLFADRRKAFTFALAMHVGRAVDETNRMVAGMAAELSTILEYFHMLVPPEQKQLRAAVEAQGGAGVVVRDDRILASLAERAKVSATGSAAAKYTDHSRRDGDGEDELKMLKEELFDSVDVTIERNMDTFARKFAVMQQRQIAAMQDVVRHESDRVIENLSSGPHDRIRDRVIAEIWKDMRWRGHVKARHFVLALRDYYLEQAHRPDASVQDRADLWALEYLDVNNVSAIAEACDDDASGFITIAEVNAFVSSRPKDWSLLKWLAWWGAGWHLSLYDYSDKIEDLFYEMFTLLPTIRAENHALAFRYLDAVWDDVSMLTWSVNEVDENEKLSSRFSGYVEAEERRLEESLKAFRYKIDARDTLSLITGPGRIETVMFPLLYLLLRRHLDVLRLCHSKVVIHHAELEDCAASINCVLDEVDERGYFLERIFGQRNLNPKREFKNFACGVFEYWFNDEEKWTIKGLMEEDEDDSDEPEFGGVASETLPHPDDVLFYPTASEDATVVKEESLTETDLKAVGTMKDILGQWYGYFQDSEGTWPAFPMFAFFLHSAGEGAFTSKSVTVEGDSYVIKGQVTENGDRDGRTTFAATWTFGSFVVWSLTGVFSDDKQSISGAWHDTRGDDGDGECPQIFYLTRLSPEILVARPAPWKFEENRVDALWAFLREHVRQRFQRRLSWTYIKDYLTRSRRYVDLLMKERERDEEDWESATTDSDDIEDDEELEELRRSFTYDQALLCHRILDMRVRAATSIDEYECDICEKDRSGAHYTCIQCSLKLDYSVDICNEQDCREATTDLDEITHLPTHDVIRLRRPTLVYHDLPHLFRLAKETLKRAQDTLKKSSAAGLKPRASVKSLGRTEEGTEGERRKAGEGALEDSDEDARSETSGSSSSQSAAGGRAASTTDTASRSFASRKLNPRRKKAAAIGPTCASCSKEVRRPCLVCIECTDLEDVFICEQCDAKLEGVSAGKHVPNHTLVRCPAPPSLLGMNGALGAVERQLRELIDSQAAAQSGQVAALNERMSRIEQLLEKLAAKQRSGRR